MTSRHSMTVICIALVAATLSLPAQGNKVQGTATVGTTKITLTNGMAVAYKAPNGDLVSVVLSDQPVDAKEFAGDTRTGPGEPLVAGLFEGAWKSQHIAKKLSGVTFTIGPRGLMSEEFLVGGRNNTFSIGADEYVLDVKSHRRVSSARSGRSRRRSISAAAAEQGWMRPLISRSPSDTAEPLD